MEQSIEKKKAFALAAIRPYAKDPSTCGYNPVTHACMNLTRDGKMCVAGKYLLPEIRNKFDQSSIGAILYSLNNNQNKVFVREAVDILERVEWAKLQSIHDKIARNHFATNTGTKAVELALSELELDVYSLGLFTYEEMMDFSTL